MARRQEHSYESSGSYKLLTHRQGRPKLNTIHKGVVKIIKPFGAIVSINGYRRTGLVHISQMAQSKVDSVTEGEEVWVKVIPDKEGKLSLSMKDVDQTTGDDLDANLANTRQRPWEQQQSEPRHYQEHVHPEPSERQQQRGRRAGPREPHSRPRSPDISSSPHVRRSSQSGNGENKMWRNAGRFLTVAQESENSDYWSNALRDYIEVQGEARKKALEGLVESWEVRPQGLAKALLGLLLGLAAKSTSWREVHTLASVVDRLPTENKFKLTSEIIEEVEKQLQAFTEEKRRGILRWLCELHTRGYFKGQILATLLEKSLKQSCATGDVQIVLEILHREDTEVPRKNLEGILRVCGEHLDSLPEEFKPTITRMLAMTKFKPQALPEKLLTPTKSWEWCVICRQWIPPSDFDDHQGREYIDLLDHLHYEISNDPLGRFCSFREMQKRRLEFIPHDRWLRLRKNAMVYAADQWETGVLQNIDLCINQAWSAYIITLWDLVKIILRNKRLNLQEATIDEFTKKFGYIGNYDNVQKCFELPDALIKRREIPMITTAEVLQYVVGHLGKQRARPEGSELNKEVQKALKALAAERKAPDSDYKHLGIRLHKGFSETVVGMVALATSQLWKYGHYLGRRELQKLQVKDFWTTGQVDKLYQDLASAVGKDLDDAWAIAVGVLLSRFDRVAKHFPKVMEHIRTEVEQILVPLLLRALQEDAGKKEDIVNHASRRENAWRRQEEEIRRSLAIPEYANQLVEDIRVMRDQRQVEPVQWLGQIEEKFQKLIQCPQVYGLLSYASQHSSVRKALNSALTMIAVGQSDQTSKEEYKDRVANIKASFSRWVKEFQQGDVKEHDSPEKTLAALEKEICRQQNLDTLAGFAELRLGTWLEFCAREGLSFMFAYQQGSNHQTGCHSETQQLARLYTSCSTLTEEQRGELNLLGQLSLTLFIDGEHFSIPNFFSLPEIARTDTPGGNTSVESPSVVSALLLTAKAEDKQLRWASTFQTALRQWSSTEALDARARRLLASAPFLVDLHQYSLWSLIFGPKLGPLSKFVQSIDDSCCLVEVTTGRYVRVPALSHAGIVQSEVATRFSQALHAGQAGMAAALLLSFALEDGALHVQGFDSCVSAWLKDDSGLTEIDKLRVLLWAMFFIPRAFRGRLGFEVFLQPVLSVMDDGSRKLLQSCRGYPAHRMMLHDMGLQRGVQEWQFDLRRCWESKSSSTSLDGYSDWFALPPLSTPSILQEASSVVGSVSVTSDADASFSQSHVPLLPRLPQEAAEIENAPALSFVPSSDSVDVREPVAELSLEKCKAELLELRRRYGVILPEDKESILASSNFQDGDSESFLKQQLMNATGRLTDELYSDDIHFVFELVQNADDNDYPAGICPELSLAFGPQELVCNNNEVGFTVENVKAICSVGASTKRKRATGSIGNKGIGFKSVFKVSRTPTVHSCNWHFKFDSKETLGYVVPRDVDPPESWHAGCGTRICLPFNVGDDGSNQQKIHSMLRTQLENLKPEILLFLHRLSRIDIRDQGDMQNLMKRRVMSRVHTEVHTELSGLRVVTLRSENYTGAAQAASAKDELWWIVQEDLEVPQRFRLLFQSPPTSKLALAFPWSLMQTLRLSEKFPFRKLYAYLPTCDYNFRFILHGDWEVTSSRESIKEGHEWNNWLAEQLPSLFLKAVRQLVKYARDELAATQLAEEADTSSHSLTPRSDLRSRAEPEQKNPVKGNIDESDEVGDQNQQECLVALENEEEDDREEKLKEQQKRRGKPLQLLSGFLLAVPLRSEVTRRPFVRNVDCLHSRLQEEQFVPVKKTKSVSQGMEKIEVHEKQGAIEEAQEEYIDFVCPSQAVPPPVNLEEGDEEIFLKKCEPALHASDKFFLAEGVEVPKLLLDELKFPSFCHQLVSVLEYYCQPGRWEKAKDVNENLDFLIWILAAFERTPHSEKREKMLEHLRTLKVFPFRDGTLGRVSRQHIAYELTSHLPFQKDEESSDFLKEFRILGSKFLRGLARNQSAHRILQQLGMEQVGGPHGSWRFVVDHIIPVLRDETRKPVLLIHSLQFARQEAARCGRSAELAAELTSQRCVVVLSDGSLVRCPLNYCRPWPGCSLDRLNKLRQQALDEAQGGHGEEDEKKKGKRSDSKAPAGPQAAACAPKNLSPAYMQDGSDEAAWWKFFLSLGLPRAIPFHHRITVLQAAHETERPVPVAVFRPAHDGSLELAKEDLEIEVSEKVQRLATKLSNHSWGSQSSPQIHLSPLESKDASSGSQSVEEESSGGRTNNSNPVTEPEDKDTNVSEAEKQGSVQGTVGEQCEKFILVRDADSPALADLLDLFSRCSLEQRARLGEALRALLEEEEGSLPWYIEVQTVVSRGQSLAELQQDACSAKASWEPLQMRCAWVQQLREAEWLPCRSGVAAPIRAFSSSAAMRRWKSSPLLPFCKVAASVAGHLGLQPSPGIKDVLRALEEQAQRQERDPAYQAAPADFAPAYKFLADSEFGRAKALEAKIIFVPNFQPDQPWHKGPVAGCFYHPRNCAWRGIEFLVDNEAAWKKTNQEQRLAQKLSPARCLSLYYDSCSRDEDQGSRDEDLRDAFRKLGVAEVYNYDHVVGLLQAFERYLKGDGDDAESSLEGEKSAGNAILVATKFVYIVLWHLYDVLLSESEKEIGERIVVPEKLKSEPRMAAWLKEIAKAPKAVGRAQRFGEAIAKLKVLPSASDEVIWLALGEIDYFINRPLPWRIRGMGERAILGERAFYPQAILKETVGCTHRKINMSANGATSHARILRLLGKVPLSRCEVCSVQEEGLLLGPLSFLELPLFHVLYRAFVVTLVEGEAPVDQNELAKVFAEASVCFYEHLEQQVRVALRGQELETYKSTLSQNYMCTQTKKQLQIRARTKGIGTPKELIGSWQDQFSETLPSWLSNLLDSLPGCSGENFKEQVHQRTFNFLQDKDVQLEQARWLGRPCKEWAEPLQALLVQKIVVLAGDGKVTASLHGLVEQVPPLELSLKNSYENASRPHSEGIKVAAAEPQIHAKEDGSSKLAEAADGYKGLCLPESFGDTYQRAQPSDLDEEFRRIQEQVGKYNASSSSSSSSLLPEEYVLSPPRMRRVNSAELEAELVEWWTELPEEKTLSSGEEQINQRFGSQGEKCVTKFLAESGFTEVKWANAQQEAGLSYDVSFKDKEARLVFGEVKTSREEPSSIRISWAQLDLAQRLKQQFWLFAVHLPHGERRAQLRVLKNPYGMVANKELELHFHFIQKRNAAPAGDPSGSAAAPA